MHNNLR